MKVSKSFTKSFMAILIAISMVVAPVASMAAAEGTSVKDYEDIPENHWAKDILQNAIDEGILVGYGDGTIRPDAKVTRAEYASMIVRNRDYNKPADISNFKDVKEKDWFYNDIQKAVGEGIIAGRSNDTMAPRASIRREEAFRILAQAEGLKGDGKNLKGFKDGDKVSSWAKEAVSGLIEAGIVSGHAGEEKLLDPKGNLTRAQAATLLVKLLEINKEPEPGKEGKLDKLEDEYTLEIPEGDMEIDSKKLGYVTEHVNKVLELEEGEEVKVEALEEAGQYKVTLGEESKTIKVTFVEKTEPTEPEEPVEKTKEELETEIAEIEEMLENASDEALPHWIEALEKELAELQEQLAELEAKEEAEKAEKLAELMEELEELGNISKTNIDFSEEHQRISEEILELGGCPEGYVVVEIDDYLVTEEDEVLEIDGNELEFEAKYKNSRQEKKGKVDYYEAFVGTREFLVSVEKLEVGKINWTKTNFNVDELQLKDAEGNIYKAEPRKINLRGDIEKLGKEKLEVLKYSFNYKLDELATVSDEVASIEG